MPLVLAIEPDPRQAATLKRVVKGRVRAELVLVDSKDAALASLASRIPDLILVSALLPPRDEDDLTQHLKALDHAGHLQTLTIPFLAGAPAEEQANGSVFGKFRRKKKAAPIDGCDPDVFGEEIETYLQRAAEMQAEERAREAAQRENVLVDQAIVADDAGQDVGQIAGAVILDAEQDFSPALQEPDADEPPLPIERPVDLVEQDSETARQDVAPAPADAAIIEARPAVEGDVAEPVYRPAFTGTLVIPFDRSRPPVEEPRSVLVEPQTLADEASSEPQAAVLETPVAQVDFGRAKWGLAQEPAQEPPAIAEADAAPSESEFFSAEQDAPADAEPPSIFVREARTPETTDSFPQAARFEAHQAFDEPTPASMESETPASQEAWAALEETAVAADEAPVAADTAPDSVILEQDLSPVAADARVEVEPADLCQERVAVEEQVAVEEERFAVGEQAVAVEEQAVSVEQEPAVLSRDFRPALDVANAPVIHDTDSACVKREVTSDEVVEPEVAVDEQDAGGADAERQLEPWEQLLRQIAAQQEALNAEAARAAEMAQANAEAARAEMAAASALQAAAAQAEESAIATPDLKLEALDDPEAPVEIVDSRDAEAAEQHLPEIQPAYDDTPEVSATASASDTPVRRSTSAAVHSALTRALAPLHAFVGRVTSGRKSAAAAAAPADQVATVTSTAVDESVSECEFAPPDATADDIVLLDNAVEGVMSQPDDSPVATLDAAPEQTADEDWHDVTPLVGRESPIEQQETVVLQPEPPLGEPAATQTAAPEDESRRPSKGGDGKKVKKGRRRSRAREKRAHDFESVLERLDGAWVASAIAALRVDIERLRQDTLAAVPMASASGPEPDQPKSGGKAAPGASGNGHDQVPEAAESQPVQDEWGFYDPGRCGIQALMAKLDAQAADNGATQQGKPSPMQRLIAHHDEGAASPPRAAASTTQHDRRPAPLAMWARAGEPLEYDPQYVVPAEPLPQMPGISPALRLPDHVSAVRYASGCRIRRVRVAPGPTRAREDKRQVVILSRKALDEAR